MQTAIKVPSDVHRRLKDFAEDKQVTMGAAITALLDEHRRRTFYERLEHETADDSYLIEHDDVAGLTDADVYLDRLESGR